MFSRHKQSSHLGDVYIAREVTMLGQNAQANSSLNSRNVFFVLGCYRSGTSAITRVLPVFGVKLYGHLMEPGPANKRGFWENEDIHKINHSVSNLIGITEKISPGSINAEILAKKSLYPDLLSCAVEELNRGFQTSSYIGIKNPHCSRLLIFWQEAIRRAGGREHYIIALRNPRSAVCSLRAFMKTQRPMGYAVWLEYTVRAVQDTIGKPRVIVAYEDLLEDPILQVQRIGRELGLNGQINQKELEFYTDQYIDRKLEHVHYDGFDLKKHCRELPIVADVYELLLQRAAEQVDEKTFVRRWEPLYERYCIEMPEFYRANPKMMDPKPEHWINHAWYRIQHVGLKESMHWLLTHGPKRAWTSVAQMGRRDKNDYAVAGSSQNGSDKQKSGSLGQNKMHLSNISN